MRLPGGISPEDFTFSASWRHRLCARYGIDDEPTVACALRLIGRKEQNALIRVWPWIPVSNPRTRPTTVGKSPYQGGPWKVVQESPVAANIAFMDEVLFEELAVHHSLDDVFVIPCRTHAAGMDLERPGIVYLGACAVGLPVVAGDSGGAPEVVINGKTGVVCSGHHPAAVASTLVYMLDNPSHVKEMGRPGLAWADKGWHWSIPVAPLWEELLTEPRK